MGLGTNIQEQHRTSEEIITINSNRENQPTITDLPEEEISLIFETKGGGFPPFGNPQKTRSRVQKGEREREFHPGRRDKPSLIELHNHPLPLTRLQGGGTGSASKGCNGSTRNSN